MTVLVIGGTGLIGPDSEAELSARFQREVLPLADVLFGGAMRLTRKHADAEDLVQDTLMHAYAGFRTFRHDTNLKAWLFRILHNQFITAHRRRQRRPAEHLADEISDQTLAASAAHSSTRTDSPEARVLDGLPDEGLRTALKALPEGFRTALYYADVEGYPCQEIAIIMGIPIGTVMSRLHRGRKRLRDSLSTS